VSADSLAAYAPGIPNLLPGELITAPTLEFLRHTATSPFGHVRGAVDPQFTQLRVLTTPDLSGMSSSR
jgi:lysine decarboxylase